MSASPLPNGVSPSRSPEVDYPAAHSMDSSWFAIDKNGYIGLFGTGEAGAMPANVANEQEEDFEEVFRRVATPCEVIYDFQGRRRPGTQFVADDFGPPGMGESTLIFVRSLDLVQDAIREGRAHEVRAVSDHAVIWQNMSQEEYDRLVASDQLIETEFYFTYEGAVESLATRGIYIYGHTCENWIAGPYGREELPGVPLHVDQLPPPVRQQMKRCRFEKISFADAAHIQPAEFVECSAWGDRFLGTDGKQYAFGTGGVNVLLEDTDENGEER